MSDDWQKVKEIFHAALRQKPEVRAEYLDEVCADDDLLRREVESLLSSYIEDSFLEQPAVGEVADAVLGEISRLTKGATLSHYRIISQLGTGGMGEVYLAEDNLLKREVAIKLLNHVSNKNQDHLRRFFQEARSASALNHPNILTIHEIGEFEGSNFIATEYIKGETLRDCLKRESFALSETFEVAVQIAAALSAAHKAGIIHRDIKPENVMRRDDGLVKVLDFGLAKLTAQTHENLGSEAPTRAHAQTNPGLILGTVTYMSPEQARGQTVDARTDIFSFGVVLYEMLTGRLPFPGGTTSDVIAAILKSEPAPLAESVSDIPKDLERIVNKTLRKNREERYQHIKDLLIDLRDLKNEMDFEAKTERSAAREKFGVPPLGGNLGDEVEPPKGGTPNATSSAEYLTGEIKKHKLGFAFVSLILLLTAGGLGFWYFNTRVAKPTQIRSIAVLPLENLSGDPAQDFFADGMTEALISNLSQIHALTTVTSRTSVMRYKGSRAKSLPEIAAELKVDAVIEGTVQRSGGRVLVTAKLIPAATDSPIWAREYNREMSDVLKLESEVARAVADEIRIQVTTEEGARLDSARRIDPAAQEEYLLGRYYNWKLNEEDLKRGIEHLERAIQLAPDYAPAYAELSDAWRTRGVMGTKTFKEVEAPARAAALKAIELDPNLAEGHLNLANLKYIYDWDWSGAEEEMKRAVELDPNSMNAHYAYAYLLMALGRFPEAVTHIKITAQLDPTSSLVQSDVGRILNYDQKFDEAIEHLIHALELEPGNDYAHSAAYGCLADVYEQTGKYAEAIATLVKAEELQPDYWVYKSQIARVYAKSGRRDEALRILEEYKTKVGPGRFSKIGLAEIYAALGQNDEAFRFLTNVIEERDQLSSFIKIDASFDSLHSDPRWNEVLRRMNFPPD